MVAHRVAGAPLDFAALRTELAVPGDFARSVLDEAETAARAPQLPDNDATDLPLVTVDPPGSRDLDQAVHLARAGDGSGGYVVSYAIADVAAFVAAGSELDAGSRRRGQTFYFPDLRVPQLPPRLSEDAASLLPNQVRPAVLWQITLDAHGMPQDVKVNRARVRSIAQLDYPGVQRALADKTLPPALELLEEIGRKRQALARARHAINLDLPEQDVSYDNGTVRLTTRAPLPVEGYNAEISLLTGMCAAKLMLEHRVGLLRTVPNPSPGTVEALRRVALSMKIDWPHGAAPGDVLATLDRANPHHVALIDHAASLLRGAAYTNFDGALPEHTEHAGIGAPYAHVTAPLRRLVDRFGSEVCLAIAAGTDVPSWTRQALPELPALMATSDHLAHAADRAVVDATEAWLLADRVGQTFDALVIDAEESAGTIMLDDPAVRARCAGKQLPVGERITARLMEADVATRSVRFQAA